MDLIQRIEIELAQPFPRLSGQFFAEDWLTYQEMLAQRGSTADAFCEQKAVFMLLILEALNA